MPRFRYDAIDAAGARQHGVIEAADREAAIARLRDDGKLPVGLAVDAGGATFAHLFTSDMRPGLRGPEAAETLRELAIMLGAGQPLDAALSYLVDTAPNRRRRACLEALRNRVREGAALSAALAADPASFKPLHVGLVKAGEAGGQLAEALDRLASLLERERALVTIVQSALIYPALLLIAAIAAIATILTQVLPQFAPLFAEAGANLPASTRALIAAGDLLSAHGLTALAILLLALLAARLALRNDRIAIAADRLKLGIPIVGPVLREALAARFTRGLGALLASGVPLIAALRITAGLMGNRAAMAEVAAAEASATAGAGLGLADRVFPPRTAQLLRLGERNGALAAMALRAADIHEDRTRLMVQRLLALLVPSLTIALGAVIAGIVAALLNAMLSLNDLAA